MARGHTFPIDPKIGLESGFDQISWVLFEAWNIWKFSPGLLQSITVSPGGKWKDFLFYPLFRISQEGIHTTTTHEKEFNTIAGVAWSFFCKQVGGMSCKELYLPIQTIQQQSISVFAF